MSMFQAKDYTGKRFGFLTVIEKTDKKGKDGSYIWVSKCDCGNLIEYSASRLHRKKCCNSKCSYLNKSGCFSSVDWTGEIVNDCTVIEATRDRNFGYVIWKLRCGLCGNDFTRDAAAIKRGKISHHCREWWAKYGASRNRGRPPIPNSGAHVNIQFHHYENAAKTRSLEFSLTMNQFRNLSEQNCHYCGDNPRERKASNNLAGTWAWNGIDRKNPDFGYDMANCLPCCTKCNFAKGSMQYDEFLQWIKAVHDHSLLRIFGYAH